MRGRRLAVVGAVGLLLAPAPCFAHPMGNFSVSHYSALRIGADSIDLRHVLDMAEIPTFQEIQETGIVPEVGHPGLGAYLGRKAETLKEGLRLEVDGRRLVLRTVSREVIFPPGAGGLPTMKLGFLYRATLGAPAGTHELRFRDENLPDRTGWKEVIARPGAGVVLASSSVPERDRSAELGDYPVDPLSNPPQALEAHVLFSREPSLGSVAHRGSSSPTPDPPRHERPADGPLAAGLLANRQATPRTALTEMVATRQTGVAIVLLAAIVAAGLGALHALEPGHGKTIVAAYLVGSRGTAWHAMLLGLTVTLSHTAGVYLLGGLTLYASRYVVPERLYPWLAAVSGLSIAALGLILLWQRSSGADHAHPHGHAHGHAHSDDHHAHDSHVPHVHAGPASGVALRDLVALGVSGGIVPCPAALIVLLSAFSLRRTGFGLFLIVAFSVGLAAVLIAVGLLVVYARHLVARFRSDGPVITRWLPLTSAAVVTLLGLVIALQALRAGIPGLGL